MSHIKKFACKIMVPSLAALLFSSFGFGQEFEHGKQALQLFDSEGFYNSPLWVQIWVGFMVTWFMGGLFFVKNHLIARWVVGGMVAGMICSSIIANIFGIPNYSGYIALIHLIFWTPGLIKLLTQRPFVAKPTAFSIWSGVMTFVICFSFIFDIRDAVIFLQHSFA